MSTLYIRQYNYFISCKYKICTYHNKNNEQKYYIYIQNTVKKYMFE